MSISLGNFNFFKTLLWTGELRQAIVSMMLRKDEIEEKNRYESLSGKCVVYIASETILWIPFLAAAVFLSVLVHLNVIIISAVSDKTKFCNDRN